LELKPGPFAGESGDGPNEWVDRFGSDALRIVALGAGSLSRDVVLRDDALLGSRRFLDRAWRQLTLRFESGKFVSRRMLVQKHRLIHEVTQCLASWRPHSAVAALMKFVRFLSHPDTTIEEMDRNAMETFVVVLSPFAPYLAEELWHRLGHETSIREAPWPVASDELVHPPERNFAILIDGKVRDRMDQPSDLEPENLELRALQRDRIREIIGERKVRRVIVVPHRLVNIVLEPAGAPAPSQNA